MEDTEERQIGNTAQGKVAKIEVCVVAAERKIGGWVIPHKRPQHDSETKMISKTSVKGKRKLHWKEVFKSLIEQELRN